MLDEWCATVIERLPCLSRPQALVLALWSYGVALAGTCGLTSLAVLLGQLLGTDWCTVRQRLREWYWDAGHKSGTQRAELDVTVCFSPLLQWVLSIWPADDHRVALAMDATNLKDRFTVLAISLLYFGCAIPVAWVVLGAHDKGSWEPHWMELLSRLEGAVPRDWLVIVTADRGLYARWLYQAIVRQGWHPFLRVNAEGKYRCLHGKRERNLTAAVPRPGTSWSGRVVCFKGKPVKCTLLAAWNRCCDEPCLVLTDLPPRQADVGWYRLRAWIESGFKDLKRGGFQWHRTRITDPSRTERMWLVLAVAALMLAGRAGETETVDCDTASMSISAANKRHSKPPLSRVRLGQLNTLAASLLGRPLPPMRFASQPWPPNDTS